MNYFQNIFRTARTIQTIKHELKSVLHQSTGNSRATITTGRAALDSTRKVANIHPDVSVESHGSRAQEVRPKDCTDAKWWYREVKGGEASSALFPKRKMMGQMRRKAEACV